MQDMVRQEDHVTVFVPERAGLNPRQFYDLYSHF